MRRLALGTLGLIGILALTGASLGLPEREIKPFGKTADLLRSDNPWKGRVTEDPLIFAIRLEELDSPSCARWLHALAGTARGLPVDGPQGWSGAFSAWEPWSTKDRADVTDCDRFPCAVKLSRSETAEMASKIGEPARFAEFELLVRERSERYRSTQRRLEYEFPGDPIDPWAFFEKQGLHADLKMPEKPVLWARKLEFNNSRIRTLRQIVDRRVAMSADRAVIWARDTYTDHYFDGWGEWGQVSCEPHGKIRIELAFAAEFDLLKNHDLFSRLSRGPLRSGAEKTAAWYLDQWFARLKEAARGARR